MNSTDLVSMYDLISPKEVYSWSAAGPGYSTAALHYRTTPKNIGLVAPTTWDPTIEVTTWARATAIVLKKMRVEYWAR